MRKPLSDELDRAIMELPPEVADFFRDLQRRGYEVNALRMQMTVHLHGEKVGGLNRRLSEWYVSKVFVRNHGGPAPLEWRGCRRIDKNASHAYWAMNGVGAMELFRDAIEEMVGNAS